MASSIKINDTLKRRVQDLADARRRTPHWIMHEAITQYVAREEARESFKNEALAAWTSYRETGLHLTGEEVRDWLNAWGSETDEAAPDCHG